MTDEKELRAALEYINPASLSYGDWMQIGNQNSRCTVRAMG